MALAPTPSWKPGWGLGRRPEAPKEAAVKGLRGHRGSLEAAF